MAFLVFIAAIAGFLYFLVKYKNRRLEPDYYQTAYKNQDTVPRGKTGIFITGLIMPESMDYPFFYNITQKYSTPPHRGRPGAF